MQSLIRFLHDQKGAVTIEFTVIVPLFVLLMVFFADASVIYLSHSEMFNTARDLARRMATGELTSAEDVQIYAEEHLFLGNRTYQVFPQYVDGQIRVTMAVPLSQAAIFGAWFGPIIGDELRATAVMASELRLVED